MKIKLNHVIKTETKKIKLFFFMLFLTVGLLFAIVAASFTFEFQQINNTVLNLISVFLLFIACLICPKSNSSL